MKRLHNWLTTNKVFFEIFSYLVIGATGIIVSLTQWRVAKNEFELHQNELQPIFKVIFTLYKTDSTQNYTTESFGIYNEGNKFKSFSYEIHPYYYINLSYFRNSKSAEIYIPVIDYYTFRSETQSLVEKLVKGYSLNNHKENSRLYFYCLEQAHQNKMLINFGRVLLTKIDYKDVNGTSHTIFFKNGGEVTEAEYKNIISIGKNQFDGIRYGISEIDETFINQVISKYKIS